MRNRIIFFGITVLFLISSCTNIITSCLGVRQVYLVVPKEYQGKITLFFNSNNAEPLKRSKGSYFAAIPSNGILECSDYFSENDSVYFHLMRIDTARNELYIDSSFALNYADFYCRIPGDSFTGTYRNRIFYTGYYYHSFDNLASDSLDAFMQEYTLRK